MEKIEFIQYRKLKNITIDFDKNINIIAGTNGTCKSSILHLISNSHQRVSNSSRNPILSTIQKMNKIFNPKIESLARGDKKYNDPAPGMTGTLYTAFYENYSLDFRRHNSRTVNNTERFAIKPKYKRGTSDRLPEIPIIYLGMFRLFSYGEWEGESKFHNIINKLPKQYLDQLSMLYKKFTGYEIKFDGKLNNLGGIRSKTEFSTNTEGIDSNTISAGEDNLLTILISLVSLKAYYESITPDTEKTVESILLIDELDASLHPEFQIKLLEEFKTFSKDYKIQIFFTTHSLSLIDYSLDKKIGNIIYLIDQIDHVDLLKHLN
ncbi:AAA family ATPase, partial [Streptococcus pyogenes]